MRVMRDGRFTLCGSFVTHNRGAKHQITTNDRFDFVDERQYIGGVIFAAIGVIKCAAFFSVDDADGASGARTARCTDSANCGRVRRLRGLGSAGLVALFIGINDACHQRMAHHVF
jgi:hypothetical protein